MLERAEARHRVESAEALPVDPAGVVKVDVEAVAAAGSRLRRGQGHPDAGRADAADVVQQRPQPQPRSSIRRPGPMPICSAT